MTAFEVDTAFLSQFEEHVVAAAQHRELWMPAGQLAALNVQIVGRILVTHVFCGDLYQDARDFPLSG